MKKQYKRSSRHNKKDPIVDVSNVWDVLLTFIVIFSLAFYQCMVPMSLAVAESGESDDATEEVQEDEEDDPVPSDDEEDDEDEIEEEDDSADAESSDETKEGDSAPSDAGQEDEDADVDSGDEAEPEEDDIAPFDARQNPAPVDARQSQEPCDSGQCPVPDGTVEDCGDGCSEIVVESINDTESEVDVIVESNTGNNEASNNGQDTEDEELILCSEIDEQLIDELQCDSMQNCLELELIECVEDPAPSDAGQGPIPDGIGQSPVSDGIVEKCVPEDRSEIEDELQEVSEECLDGDSAPCDAGQDSVPDGSEQSPIPDGSGQGDEQELVAEIDTGDAQSVVNILNNINSNIVGENWMQLIYDIQGLYEEDINLFEYFVGLLENADETSLNALLDIYNENKANITNTVIVDSNTGNNIANNNGGDVSIDTGDAVAGANVVNLVNQNLVGNNWIFAVINVFGLWTGDLIVPGNGLLDGGHDLGYSNVDIVNENNADIDNDATADVNTGNNIAQGNGGNTTVDTGNALASVNIVDIVNTNIVGSNWFFLMINNMGSWSGNIMHWDGESSGFQTVFNYVFDSVDGMFSSGSLDIHNNNSANIQNNINVQANTGGNTANDNSGDASISTGDAIAWANIFNFVNNNIVGNNWMFSIVNIMGEWTGDTVFAYPDMTVAINDGRDVATAGEKLQYTITYQNTGEAPAESVEVMVTLPKEITYETDTSGKPPSGSGGELVWNLDGVASGESRTFTVTAVINAGVTNQGVVRSVAGVRTDTAEVELDNNYASDQTSVAIVEVVVDSAVTNANAFSYDYMDDLEIHPNLALSRTSNIVGAVHSGDMVVHRVVMENIGDSPIYEIELKDKIKDVTGSTIVEYEWDDMGHLLVGEAMIIDYAININSGINPSEYNFMASASGVDLFDDEVNSNEESTKMAVVASRFAYVQDSEEDNGLKMIADVHASDGGKVLGIQNQNDASFWVWVASVLMYILIANWILSPRRKKMFSL